MFIRTFRTLQVHRPFIPLCPTYPYPFFSFCQFVHFREIASHIGMVVPKIDEQLGIQSHEDCWLVGYRIYEKPMLETNKFPSPQKPNQAQTDPSSQQQQQQNQQLTLQKDALHRQQIPYSVLQRVAKSNNLQICAISEQQKQLTLINLKEQIYRTFYFKKLFRKNSTAKKYKQIRIPQNIHLNDLKNKANNIKLMMSKGEHRFKIYAENDSQKCQQAIRKLCQLLGKQQDLELEIQEHELKPKTKKKDSVKIERWNVQLNLEKQANVNYEIVNKKWRRFKREEEIRNRVRELGIGKRTVDFQGLSKLPIHIQREALKQMRANNVKLPKEFEQYGQLEKSLEQGNFFGYVFAKSLSMMTQNQEQSSSQSPKTPDEFFPDIHEEQQNQQVDHAKETRKSLLKRTVEDILEDMEKLQSKEKHEMDLFEQHRLQELEKELRETLRKAGFKGEL